MAHGDAEWDVSPLASGFDSLLTTLVSLGMQYFFLSSFLIPFFGLHNIQAAITPLGGAEINLKSFQIQSANVWESPEWAGTTNLAVAYHLFLLGNITMKDSPH